jgi:hypothetical protein
MKIAGLDVTYSTLAVEGFRGEPVPNELVRQQAGSTTLAVLLPGRLYTCDMPLFYYAECLLVDRGWDVLRVRYDYRKLDTPISQDEQLERLAIDSRSTLDAGLAEGTYQRVILVGKSLGTIAMAHLVPTLEGADPWLVWLTPLLKRADVLECVAAGEDRSLVVIGSGDTHFDPAVVDGLRRDNHCATLVIDGGEHSLDLPGDAAGSAMSVVTTMRAIDRFLPDGDAEANAVVR